MIVKSLSNPDLENFGVKKECVWSNIGNFHVAVNFSIDMIHDSLEGMCKIEITELLHHYIYIEKIFYEEILNNSIDSFASNRSERKNKPLEIIPSNNKNLVLKFSASEAQCFMRHLDLILGERIPENSDIWVVYIFPNEILNTLSAKAFHIKTPDLLRTLISDYVELIQNLF